MRKGTLEELHRILQRLDESLVLSKLDGLSPKARVALLFLEENIPLQEGGHD